MKNFIPAKIIFSLVILMLTGPAYPVADKIALKIVSGYYTIAEHQTLNDILIEDLKIKPQFLMPHKNLAKNLRSWNPQIADWTLIPINSEIYLELPSNSVGSELFFQKTHPRPINTAMAAPIKSVIEAIPEAIEPAPSPEPIPETTPEEFSKKETHDEIIPFNESAKWSAFATFSYGAFSENFPAINSSATSNQNSPLTLGLAVVKKINPLYAISSSLYISYLTAGTISSPAAQNTTVSIPPEIGYTLYAQRDLTNNFFGSAGIDYERFTTLNIDQLAQGTATTLQTKGQQIIFGSLGVMKMFTIGEKALMSRFSIARSLWSKSESSTVNYSGYKFMLYNLYKFHPKWSGHAFIKLHSLEGSSELSIWRLGIGLSYHF